MFYRGSNRVLCGLGGRDQSLIAPHLRRSELVPGQILIVPHEPVSHVYFPRSGLLAIVVIFSDGNLAEAAVAGSNTVVGAIAAVGDGTALNHVVVSAPGAADRIEVAVLRRLVRESESLRDLLVRHSQALAAQSVQIAGCNAVHHLEARLCRWLLQCRDLVGADTLPFTQDLMSSMLGVYRPSLTHVLRKLEAAQLVALSRGRVSILNADALKQRSCECYGAIAEQRAQIVVPRSETLLQKALLPM